MENLPALIPILFMGTTFITAWLFFKAIPKIPLLILGVLAWLLFQGYISTKGFYLVTSTRPPRLMFLIAPPLLLIAVVATGRFKRFTTQCNPLLLTAMHSIRALVEIVLYLLFVHHYIPQVMTFEGRNFDVLSGLSAPFIAWFGYHKKRIKPVWLLIWNIICLALLINIVILAVCAAPYTFQRFAFDRPNIAVLHFPFVWLPGFIVPVMFFSHMVCITQLLPLLKKGTSKQ